MMDTEKSLRKKQNKAIKQFGYLVSAVLILVSVIGLYYNWVITPLLYLVTLFILTGALWIPVLIKPLYLLFGKYLIKAESGTGSGETEEIFDKLNKN